MNRIVYVVAAFVVVFVVVVVVANRSSGYEFACEKS